MKFFIRIQVKRLLRQGCEAYFAYMVDTKKEVLSLKDIPVVNESEDVISEDLPGLSPN